MDKQASKTWPKLGSWLAIKDPFFTVEEIFVTECIRVDHPSDLVYAESWPLRFLKYVHGIDLGKALSDKSERTPLEWKQAGNAALAAKDFDSAHTNYTEGIRAAAARPRPLGQDTEKDLYRNRSFVRLTLGRYEGAVSDAIAALTLVPDDDHKKLDAKANFRAARASYSLKDFGEAVLFLHSQLELCPNDKDAASLLKRTEDRVHEQRYGGYNIAKIQKSLSREPRVDVAGYIHNTAIKQSGPKRGRGLFATCDIQPGELIMAETSFCCVWRREDANLLALECNASTPDAPRANFVGLWRSAVNEAGKNPVKGGHLMRLHGSYQGTTEQVNEVDDVTVVDAFKVQLGLPVRVPALQSRCSMPFRRPHHTCSPLQGDHASSCSQATFEKELEPAAKVRALCERNQPHSPWQPVCWPSQDPSTSCAELAPRSLHRRPRPP